MQRRRLLQLALASLWQARPRGAGSVSTLIGDGVPGHSPTRVNNPFGVLVGPDGALYFCDLDNQRIRRFDLKTQATSDIAGDGRRGYTGDGGTATAASLNMPHEIAFDAAVETFENLPKARRRDPQSIEEAVKRGVRAAIASHWQKKPICLVQVITV